MKADNDMLLADLIYKSLGRKFDIVISRDEDDEEEQFAMAEL